MRKLIVLAFLTLDGVIQEPDKPDPTGRFPYGGWTVPFFDDSLEQTMPEHLRPPFDLVLGRKTYDVFAAFWPNQNSEENPMAASFNAAKKYVASHTLQQLDWQNSTLLQGDVAQELQTLKQQDGPALQVQGSANLIQTLLAHGPGGRILLVDLPDHPRHRPALICRRHHCCCLYRARGENIGTRGHRCLLRACRSSSGRNNGLIGSDQAALRFPTRAKAAFVLALERLRGGLDGRSSRL